MNRTAIVTGGSKGIGLAVAESLLSSGVAVAITSRTQHDIEEAVKKLQISYPNRIIGIPCDVRSYEAQQQVVDEVIRRWGRLDYMIANAGVGHFEDIETMQPEKWHEVIDINLTGVFYSTKVAIPALKQSQGYLITIASLAGTNFFEKGAAYNASKFGLVGYTQAVMLDLRKHGIKVTTIMPGSVATYFNGHIPSEADDWKIQPEDIGQMVVDLINMPPRTLPSKIEVRPSMPPKR